MLTLRLLARVLVSGFLCHAALATSVVVQLEKNQIIFAADTRGNKLDPGSQATDETECKIVPLEDMAFALTGNMDYLSHDPFDSVASWDSREDGRMAFADHKTDLFAMIQEWSDHAKDHYETFYRAAPRRVAQLAAANTQNVLLAGLFAGFHNGVSTLILQIVFLNEAGLPHIRDSQVILPLRDLPYTSNAITQELIEGHTERTTAADSQWRRILPSIPLAMRNLRRPEFLIQETGKYDITVGQRVDILKISPHKRPQWLQNSTCPKL
jgi:hypothetical protein